MGVNVGLKGGWRKLHEKLHNQYSSQILLGLEHQGLKSSNKGKAVRAQDMKAHRGNRRINPLIFNIGARWRSVSNITPQLLYSHKKKNSSTHFRRGWVGPEARLDIMERKTSCPYQGLNPQTIQPVA